jgi:hypothetical protein
MVKMILVVGALLGILRENMCVLFLLLSRRSVLMVFTPVLAMLCGVLHYLSHALGRPFVPGPQGYLQEVAKEGTQSPVVSRKTVLILINSWEYLVVIV